MNEARLVDAVASILREAAAAAILPRFRALAAGDVEEKSPGEIVTRADREAERLLLPRLLALVPGSVAIGEEQAAADPSVLARIDADAVWLVDPLDGTANFVAGDPRFAVMAALLRRGEAVASWMLDPLGDVVRTAVRGAGAHVGHERVRCRAAPVATADLRGAVLTRFLPPEIAAAIADRAGSIGRITSGVRCAGVEYPAIVDGAQEFAIFWRTLPWVHAPGALFVTEAGGRVTRLDGSRYCVGDGRSGLFVARDEGVAEQVRNVLLGVVPHGTGGRR